MRSIALLATVAALSAAAPASAVVITSLPNYSSADWTDVVMHPGNTANDGTKVVMTTTPGAGNWFGWGNFYGDTPAWTPGGSADGNHLAFNASFGPNGTYGGPKDWTAYFYDGSNMAYMRINPTRCDYNVESCYDNPAFAGVDLYFSDGLGGSTTTFVAVDTSVAGTYEFLMKNGSVSYRINGRAYTGAAMVGPNIKLLVIGDESGPTPTGSGTMVLNSIRFDTAPVANVLPGLVPEPASWALMIGGFGLIGGGARRRRRVAVSA